MTNETEITLKNRKNRDRFREVILGNRYACKGGSCYYPRDEFGNEYRVVGLSLIKKNGNYDYPHTVYGKPRYSVVNGSQVYDFVDGKQIIGTGLDGKQYYAVDKHGDEYYPNDNAPALLADGTPYYASAKDGKHIFPTDMFGNEYYLTFVDLNKPQTIPNRYAVSIENDEIYPLRLTNDDNEEQYLIENEYAVDKDQKPFYPKDGYKNEYYRKFNSVDLNELIRIGTMSRVLLEKYAVTYDGKIILPTLNNVYYINPNMEPSIEAGNVIGRLIREDYEISDYLTNVLDPTFDSTTLMYVKPYKYRTLISNELTIVIPKPPPTTVGIVGIIKTALPFYRRWCFWVLVIIILIVKSYVVWWFYLKNKLPRGFTIT